MNTLKEIVKSYRKSIVRVIVHRKDSKSSFGTGFVVKKGLILAPSHIFSVSDFSDERKILCDKQKQDNKENMEKLIREITRDIKIGANGTNYNGDLIYFDSETDFSIFGTRFKGEPLLPNLNPDLAIGDKVAFCGYPVRHKFSPYSNPFAANEGVISSLYNVRLIGSKDIDVIQVNAVSLSGYSGAPLFLKKSGEVVGMMVSNVTINLEVPICEKKPSGKIEIKGLKPAKIPLAGIGNAVPLKYIEGFVSQKE